MNYLWLISFLVPGNIFSRISYEILQNFSSSVSESAESLQPYKSSAEMGAAVLGFLQSVQYVVYNIYPDVHWSLWQILPAPFGIPLTLVLIASGVGSGGGDGGPNGSDAYNRVIDGVGLLVISVLDQCARISRSVAAEVKAV